MSQVRTAVPRQVTGTGVGHGAAVAPVVVMRTSPEVPSDEPIPTDPAQAMQTARDALADTKAELTRRAAGATGVLRDVLDAAVEMADDPTLVEGIEHELSRGVGPATAVDRAAQQIADTFRAAGGYLAERATDVSGVRDLLVARILGQTGGPTILERESIVVATDLSPADTAALDLDLVAGILTSEGGATSHTAIVARQLGLPCVVGATGATSIPDGALVALDAAAGTATVDPDDELRQRVSARAEALDQLRADDSPAATSDGRRVEVLANVGTVEDARRAADGGAEGVGLFRTELLFLDRQHAPTVDEQAEAYRRVLDTFAPRKVVVRTLDAGADKPLAFANQTDEMNPALGVRGFRLNERHPDLLRDQLEALARASSGTEPWVMAPMISTEGEAREFATLTRSAGLPRVGVMIEVPAAALRARSILDAVDFVSIGTNDLAQYTMAADRLSAELGPLLNIWQPAVLELVRVVADAGRDAGKPVGVCGESAADPLMALVLCGLGVTSLSMSASAAPMVRYALRRHSFAQCEHAATAALDAVDAEQARAAVLELVAPEVRDLLISS